MLDLFICSPLLVSTMSGFRVFRDSLLSVIGHEPIEAVFYLAPQKHEDTQIKSKFDYNKADWEKFKNILVNSTEVEGNVDELNEKLTNDILKAADQAIPNLTKNKKNF